jgi:hypothetical protein
MVDRQNIEEPGVLCQDRDQGSRQADLHECGRGRRLEWAEGANGLQIDRQRPGDVSSHGEKT